MHIRHLVILVVILVVILIANCSAPLTSTSVPASPTGLPTASPILLPPTALPIEPEPVQSPLATPAATITPSVAQAIADLAARLNISAGAVEVMSATADEFPASNLGCGKFSKQPDLPIPALLTGQRIVLAADGRRYVWARPRTRHRSAPGGARERRQAHQNSPPAKRQYGVCV